MPQYGWNSKTWSEISQSQKDLYYIILVIGGGYCSVAQSYPTIFEPTDCNTPGFPVLHYLLEFAQILPLSQWCHPAISSSVVPFSCLQSFPESGSFPVSRLFAPGSQSTGASASASVLPMNIQGWSPLGWTGLISLQSKGLSRVFSNATIWKHQFFGAQPFTWFSSHIQRSLMEKPQLRLDRPLLPKWCLCV